MAKRDRVPWKRNDRSAGSGGEWIYSRADHRRLISFMNKLGIESTHLIEHSYGSLICQQLLLQRLNDAPAVF